MAPILIFFCFHSNKPLLTKRKSEIFRVKFTPETIPIVLRRKNVKHVVVA